MTLIEAVIEYVRVDGVPIYGEDPGNTVYPFVIVSPMPMNPDTFNTSGSFGEDAMFQITVASVDSPKEAETIGAPIRRKVCFLGDETQPIEWDEGDLGREYMRWPGGCRQRKQDNDAPGGMTIYYYEFDFTMKIQRNR